MGTMSKPCRHVSRFAIVWQNHFHADDDLPPTRTLSLDTSSSLISLLSKQTDYKIIEESITILINMSTSIPSVIFVPAFADTELTVVAEEEITIVEEPTPTLIFNGDYLYEKKGPKRRKMASEDTSWCSAYDDDDVEEEPAAEEPEEIVARSEFENTFLFTKEGNGLLPRVFEELSTIDEGEEMDVDVEEETVEISFPLPDEGDDVDENEEASPDVNDEPEEEIVAPAVVEPVAAPTVVEPEPIVAPTPRRTQTNRAKHGAQQPQTLRRSSRLSGDAPAMSVRESERKLEIFKNCFFYAENVF